MDIFSLSEPRLRNALSSSKASPLSGPSTGLSTSPSGTPTFFVAFNKQTQIEHHCVFFRSLVWTIDGPSISTSRSPRVSAQPFSLPLSTSSLSSGSRVLVQFSLLPSGHSVGVVPRLQAPRRRYLLGLRPRHLGCLVFWHSPFRCFFANLG